MRTDDQSGEGRPGGGLSDRKAGLRARLLEHAFVLTTARRKETRRAFVLLVLVAGISLGTVGVGIDTGRQNVVSPPDPDAVRMQRYTDVFGTTLQVLTMIEGGDASSRRAFADRLARALLEQPQLYSEVIYKVRLDEVAGLLPLWGDAPALKAAAETIGERAGDVDVLTMRSLSDALAFTISALEEVSDSGGSGLGGLSDVSPDDVEAGLEHAFQTVGDALTDPTWTPDRYIEDETGERLFLLVQPTDTTGQADKLVPFVETLRAIVQKLEPRDLEVLTTGYPTYVVAETRLVERDVPLTSTVAVFGVLALFWFAFRSVYSTAVTVVPLIVGFTTTLAFAGLAYGNINVFSMACFALLAGLGVDFTIHFVARYEEAARAGATPLDSARAAVIEAGPGVITGATSTIAVFLAITATDFTAMRELGFLSAFGLLAILLPSLLLVPGLLMDRHQHLQATGRDWPMSRRDQSGFRFGPTLTKRPAITLLVCAGVTAALMPWIEPIEFSFTTTDFIPEGTETRRGYDRLKETKGFSPDYAVAMTDDLETVRRWTEEFEQRPDLIARVESLATYLAPSSAEKQSALNALHEAWAKLPAIQTTPGSPTEAQEVIEQLEEVRDLLADDLPFVLKSAGKADLAEAVAGGALAADRALERIRQVDSAHLSAAIGRMDVHVATTVSAVDARLRSGDTTLALEDLPESLRKTLSREKDGKRWYSVRLIPADSIEDPEFAGRFRTFAQSVDPDVTGLPITFVQWGILLRDGLETSAFLGLCLVFLLALVDFRSLRCALMVVAPLLVGALWMVGLVRFFGLEYNFANVLGIPLILGIGLDSGVHLLHRYVSGTSPAHLVETTGKAVAVSSITSVLAIGSLVLALHGGLSSLGQVLVIGIFACMASALVVLPALLALGAVQSRPKK